VQIAEPDPSKSDAYARAYGVWKEALEKTLR